MFLLDTDYVVLMQRGPSEELGRLLNRMAAYSDTDFYLPVVAFHEQMLGANAYISRAKSRSEVVRGYDLLHRVLTDFSDSQVLPFDDAAATVFDEFRSRGVRVGTMDLRIASIGKSKNLTVLTRNTVDFAHIPDLKVEDWTVRTT